MNPEALAWLLGGAVAALAAALAWALHRLRARQQALRALEEQRQHLQALIDALPDLLWLKGLDGRYLFGNQALKRHLAVDDAGLIGRRDSDLVPADQAEAFQASDNAALGSSAPYRLELWQQFPASGRRGLFETLKTALRDRHGAVVGVLGISRDITLQREASAHLRRMNRLYRVLTRLQDLAARQHGREALFTEVCQLLVEGEDLHLAWIGQPDAAGRRLQPVCQAGLGDEADFDGLALDAPSLPRHPACTALLEARADTARERPDGSGADPRWDPQARARGLRSLAAFPVRRGETVTAVLCVGSQDPDYFNPGEVALIERLVAQLSLALDADEASAGRRDALQALRRSEERFGSLFRFSPVGLSLRRLADGRLVDANRAWLDLLGLPREQAVGQPEAGLLRWQDAGLQARVEAELAHAGHVEGIEAVLLRADGTAIESTYAATRIELSGEGHLLSAVQDARPHHQATRALRQQARSLERDVASRTLELDLIFQALPDLYFRLDEAYRVVDYRAGQHADLYLPPEQFMDRRITDLLPPTVSAQFQQAADSLRLGRRQAQFEYTLPLPAGPVHFEARLMPLQPEGLIVVVRNVTERRAMEDARERALEEGERLARQRNRFLANMSHEIRTPINGVLGMAQIGRDRSTDPALRATFQRIVDSGRWLLTIVDDVLDLSRLEAGTLRTVREPMRPARVIGEVVELIEAEARSRGLDLTLATAPALDGLCQGDPVRLRQVALKLLANAVKFTEHGRVDVSAGLDGVHWWLRVRDTGPGMAADLVARLFQPFQQADASNTRRHGGTGLGLAISQRLARLMGGELSVQSQPGAGSCFELRLPWEAAPEAAAPGARPLRLQGLRLLVAEDNLINQEVIGAMLADEGAEVLMAGDGAQALALVAREGEAAIDLVLMDLQMPVMDGFEAARRLQSLAPGLPIVAQTAHAFGEERERSAEAGMREHLTKPIEHERLVEAVLAHARRRPG